MLFFYHPLTPEDELKIHYQNLAYDIPIERDISHDVFHHDIDAVVELIGGVDGKLVS